MSFHRDWAVQLGMCRANRIVAIPNGIAEPVCGTYDRAKIREEIGFDPATCWYLHRKIGFGQRSRNISSKQPQCLLDCRIRIARTDGPARDRLIQLTKQFKVTDRVHFIG